MDSPFKNIIFKSVDCFFTLQEVNILERTFLLLIYFHLVVDYAQFLRAAEELLRLFRQADSLSEAEIGSPPWASKKSSRR